MKISDPKDKGKQYSIKYLIKDIWVYSGKRKKYLVVGSLLRLLGDIAGLYPTYALATLVTYIATQTPDPKHIITILVLWFTSSLIRFWGLFFAKKYIYYAGYDVAYTVEKKMLGVLIAKDSAWHEAESSGVKIKRIERGSNAYKEILYLYVGNYIEITTRIVGITFILSKFDTTISLLVGFFLISYFAISKYLQKRCIAAAHEYNVEDDQVGGIVYETVSNIRTIRVLDVGQEMLRKISVYIKKAATAVSKRINLFQFRGAFMATYAQLFRVLVTGYIAYNILEGKYAVGVIVLFSSYFLEIWETMRELMDVSQDLIVGRQSIYRMYDLIGKEIPNESAVEKFPEQWDALHIENLSFYYGENQALNNISFSVKNGQKVGIVGLSGAGKSTLFKLLIRERTDYSGNIKIGDIKIQDIQSSDFYKHVSIVPQDTEVFNFSLKENITLAQPEKVDDDKLFERSIEIGHVKDFLGKLKNGIDTVIGERGVKLSGGERQRLGIARAIFKQPSILLLDEATSHLDLESEEKIKDSLHTFFENVTAIVIAHRLTTIREMDKIIVIQDGGIIEEGSYDELMKKKGRFYEVWQKQLF